MNEARAASGGSGIVLAQEKPFRLARTLVRPAALEVEFQSEMISIEPRVMQVLVALNRADGEPTSRRRLIECCWGGRRVTDGALNRSIAQLRKALADPGIEVSTIARVGYRLRASSSTTETLQSPSVAAPGISTAFPESAGGLPPTAGVAVDSVPNRGATHRVAAPSAFSRRGTRVAAVVAVALLGLAIVVWEWVTSP